MPWHVIASTSGHGFVAAGCILAAFCIIRWKATVQWPPQDVEIGAALAHWVLLAATFVATHSGRFCSLVLPMLRATYPLVTAQC